MKVKDLDINVKNYICRPITELPSYMFALVEVPSNSKMTAGEIYEINSLVPNTRNDNVQVYVPSKIYTNVSTPVIILNDSLETLRDGRRPNGNGDYTTYIYQEKMVVNSVKLLPEQRFELSPDNLSNVDAFVAAIPNGVANTWLYPDVSTNKLKWTNTFADIDTKVYLIIESLKELELGGMFGNEFAQTMVVRVKHTIPEFEYEELTGIAAEVTPDLMIGDENTGAGATVVTLANIGGKAPVAYALKANPTLGADNDLFVVDGNEIKVGATDLEDAKDYQVYVEATDAHDEKIDEGFDIPVSI